MVFDFFKKRSEEGIEQLSKLGDAAREGKLVQGLAEAAAYTRLTNDAFANGLAKSRSRFLNNLEGFFTGRTDGDMDGILDDLLDVLLQADLGMATSEDIIEEIKLLKDDSEKFLSRDDLLSIMRGKLIETLDTGAKDGSNGRAIRFEGSEIEDQVDTPLSTTTDGETKKIPTVLFIIGANGQGKTTSIGKLAHRLKNEGNQTVLMAACDTYRAGAVEQLQQWADRAEVDLVSPSESVTSPSAVVYSALDKALNEGYDTVLIDTSGRLSNNAPLTQELVKMKRVIQKRLSIEKDPETNKPIPNTNVPHECLLVLDAAQGRMALDSARIWNKEVGLTGLILTKLDGSARGGSVVAISRDLNLPVKLIGVGEGIEDLRDVSTVNENHQLIVMQMKMFGFAPLSYLPF
jgi:fused signal recognition particle receptor